MDATTSVTDFKTRAQSRGEEQHLGSVATGGALNNTSLLESDSTSAVVA